MPPSEPRDIVIPMLWPGGDCSPPISIMTCRAIVSRGYKSVKDPKKSEVIQVRWYKYTYHSKLEYGVATVKRDGITYYIRFERGQIRVPRIGVIGTFACKVIQVIRLVAPRAQFWADLEGDIRAEYEATLRMLNNPQDVSVTHVIPSNGMTRQEKGSSSLLATYTFEPGSLCLRDLILTMVNVREAMPIDMEIKAQSYWFMSTMIKILERNCNPTVEEAQYFNTAGTYWKGVGFRNVKNSYGINMDETTNTDETVQKLASIARENIEKHDAGLYEEYGWREEAEARTREAEARTQEAEVRTQEIQAQTQELQAQTQEIVAQRQEIEAQTLEIEAWIQAVRKNNQEAEERLRDIRKIEQELEGRAQDDEGRAQTLQELRVSLKQIHQSALALLKFEPGGTVVTDGVVGSSDSSQI